MSDFSPKDRELLRNHAKWKPDIEEWVQVSILITDFARKLADEA
jgi:hypothetical protein